MEMNDSSAAAQTVMVVNPQSANGTLGRQWEELSRTIGRELAFEDVHTAAPGDATRLTREALRQGAECVVAIGGDGTISEVVNGFFEDGKPINPEAALGVLPYGTGGDFRKSAHIPKDLTRAARVLARGKRRKIDAGLLEHLDRDRNPTSRVFVNIASFGISGMVDRYVNETSKRLGGMLSFAVATVRAAVRYKNQRVRVVFDDDDASAEEMTINTVAVANGRFFGGGMHIAPKAELDDGFFDVVALGDFGFADFLVNGRHIYSGSHLGMEGVSHRRAKKVHAEPLDTEDVELDVDGETPGILPATFTVLPGALSLVVP